MQRSLPSALRLLVFWSLVVIAIQLCPGAAWQVQARTLMAPAAPNLAPADAPSPTPTDPVRPGAGDALPPTNASEIVAPAAVSAPQRSGLPNLGPIYVTTRRRVTVRTMVRLHVRRSLASRGGHLHPLLRSMELYRIRYERRPVAVDVAPIIMKHAQARHVDPYLVKAVMRVESNFHNRATSCVGACGLMQLMPGTGRSMGASNLYDPEQNIAAGVRYLGGLLKRYGGRLELAIAAYNAGPGNVHHRVPDIAETRRYVKKVLHFYRLFKGLPEPSPVRR